MTARKPINSMDEGKKKRETSKGVTATR